MKILDRRDLNLAPIFIVASVGLQVLILLIVIMVFGKFNQVANKKPPTLVELSDGTSIRVAPIGNSERTEQAISNFVGKTMVELMSWNALIPTLNTDELANKKKPQLDAGVQVGEKKITTHAWASGFALSEDFRKEFMEGLGILTPTDVFSGQVSSALIVRHISNPQKIASGKWKLSLVSNLVIFENGNQVGKAIKFNKTIYVRAIETPQLPQNPSPIQQTAYTARKAGLEIYKIQDLFF